MKISAIHTPYDGLEVWVDGEILTPKPSQKVINHSPDGFSAGYLGSDAAQLALAILLKATNRQTAIHYYQRFKEEFLADPYYLDHSFSFEVDIKKWLAGLANEVAQQSAQPSMPPRCACGKPATINNRVCSDCAFEEATRK